jgi:ATP-dependent protease ClpP protease subunit
MIEYRNQAEYLEFDLFGDVGESWWDDTITVDKVKNILNDNQNKNLLFNISSLGGDVNEALIIHDIIRMHKGQTKSRIIGATASAGTIIGLSTDEVEMSENALFLIHNVWGFAIGNAQQLRKDAERMDKFDDRLANIYLQNAEKRNVEKKKSEIFGLMEEEKWINAEEAAAWGFIDEIKDINLQPAQMSMDNKLPAFPKIYLNKYNTMGLFKSKDKNVTNSVKTADGENTFLYENELTEGSELMLLGKSQDEKIEGKFTLEGDKKITVEDNKVTVIEEIQASSEPEVVTMEALSSLKDEIVNAVADELAPIVAKQEEIDAQFAALKNGGSKGNPKKSPGPINDGKIDATDLKNSIKEARKEKQAKYQAKKELR